MHVDQRQVTVLDLQDGRGREVTVVKDGWGYKLSFVSKEDVVTVLLSAHDLHKLSRVIAGVQGSVADRDCHEAPQATPTERASYAWQGSALEWISFN